MASDIRTLAKFGNTTGALLLYDMTLPFGTLRIAEQFDVAAGRITLIRHVHDTAAVRSAGLGPAS